MTTQLQVFPYAEQAAQLAALVDEDGAFETATVDLYINNATPNIESVDGDFTIPNNTQFPGYTTSSAVTWVAGQTQDGQPAQIGAQKVFVASAAPPDPLLCYGFVLKGTTGRRLYAKFETPIPVVDAFDYVAANPILTLSGGVLDLFL